MAVNGSAQRQGRLRFGAFVFDADRAELRHSPGAVVPLRPKMWALLAFPLSRPGQIAEAVRLLQGRLDEALEAYGRAAALDGALHAARANIGYLLLLLGRAEEAEAPLRASIALDPRNPVRGDWQGWLGQADLVLGRNDQGVRHFRTALDHPGTQTAEGRRLHLAAALALDGQIEEAHAIVAELLAREPHLSMDSFRRIQRSGHPTYPTQRDRLCRGLALAGLPDASDVDTRLVRLSWNQQGTGSR